MNIEADFKQLGPFAHTLHSQETHYVCSPGIV